MKKRPVITLDFETRSAADLKVCGAHRYAQDPTTTIMLASYKFDDGPVHHWRFGEDAPYDLVAAILDGFTVIAHNAGFERAVWNAQMSPELQIKPERMDCTMARAQAVGLPGALFALGKTLKLPQVKDYDGHAIMMKLCRPRGQLADGSFAWHEDPKDIARLQDYCDQDVRTECEVDKRLPPLSPFERQVWELDQVINDRGVQLDVQMVQEAHRCVVEAVRRADERMAALTSGAVRTVGQVAKIVAWIKAQGVPCESIAEGEHEELICGAEIMGLPAVQEAIALRAASAKAFKFKTMLECLCRDGRVRGSLRYSATIQRRWAGAGVQFHNMKRVETDEDAVDVALAVKVLHAQASTAEKVDRLELLFGSPLNVLSLCTRSSVVAKPGHRLIGGDYSNIEGRINAWMAGQTDKLEAFRAYDRGQGPDLYRVTAGRIIGVEPDRVTKAQRQEQGKVPELACGYQGSLGAFKKMGAKYGVRLPDPRIRGIVAGWREANPKIVDLWAELQEAAIGAVTSRGMVVSAAQGRVRYVADKAFLYCKLPSGGVIHYPSPSVGWKTKKVIIDGDEVEFNRITVSYWTTHNGQLVQNDLYGGAQCAHVVSGTARDILCVAMLRAEAAGYPLVLTVHDELLCEVPEGQGSAEGLKDLMLEPIDWLGGCPIAASTWEGPRYLK